MHNLEHEQWQPRMTLGGLAMIAKSYPQAPECMSPLPTVNLYLTASRTQSFVMSLSIVWKHGVIHRHWAQNQRIRTLSPALTTVAWGLPLDLG